MALVIILSACIYTTGCFSSGDLEAQRDEVISAISAHRTSFDNYFIVYTIGIDLWNIEVSGGSVNSRVLRTQIAREEGFLADVSGKHRQVSASVTRFWGIAQTLEGNEGARASDIAWNLRVYDEEMWNAQNALIGRLSSLRQYLDMVDAGKKDAAEALSYLESANTLSLDAAGAIGRADAARIRAESG
ncbi:hypothetical protein [Methanocalculus sp.]|uniref:hypothetical protein n=1 Tax=Methanocalculus sp. TaxID=2004547 RepID=UPI002725BA9A|nr:hypothetical protein [Methanocalculus sp.]MDO8842402.1 hypothetical protein [Methanocalculus sp.]